jgi:hypothetical protein
MFNVKVTMNFAVVRICFKIIARKCGHDVVTQNKSPLFSGLYARWQG